MILTAKQSNDSQPTHMSLVFNEAGNVDSVQMIVQGQSKEQKFDG